MNPINKPVGLPIITGRPDTARPQQKLQAQGATFAQLLEQTIQKEQQTAQLTFSRHAMNRTAERGIELDADDLRKLEGAVGKAQDRGLNDTLVLMNNTAFIVNVPNRVVVTVVDGKEDESTVFTNIDGAVIV